MHRSNNERQEGDDPCRIIWAIICCPCFSVYYLFEKTIIHVIVPCCTYLSKCLDYFCSKILEAISKKKKIDSFVDLLFKFVIISILPSFSLTKIIFF